jgi:alpha-1,3-rhamnosyltransferase
MKMPDTLENQELVSVFIAAYNHGKYVQSTIHSILEQTYKNIELIIVNDGSTDDTHEKIENLLPRCRERFVRTEYLQKSNEGVIKALNQFLSLAEGKYAYFIASDDIAEPTAIEKLYTFLAGHHDFGLAVGDSLFIDDTGKQCYWSSKQTTVYDKQHAAAVTHAEHLQHIRKDVDFNGSSFGSYKTLLSGNYIPNGYLIRTEIIRMIGGYSEKAKLEDLHLMLQLAKHTKFKFIKEPLFRYRWHDSNTSKQKDRMKQYTQQTLRMEKAYAKQHRLRKYLPTEKTLSIGDFKLVEFKRNTQWCYFRMLNKSFFSQRIKNGKRVFRLLGIKVYQGPIN